MSERPTTVKLSMLEWTNVVLAVVRELGEDAVKGALRRALGEDRANKLIVDKRGPALSKDDNRAIVREVYKLAPGETEDAKMVWAMELFEGAFDTRERYLEVLQFVRSRVEADKAAGGTIYNPPPKQEQEAQWRRDLATIKAENESVEFFTRGLSRPVGGGHNADGGMEWIIARITGSGFERLLIMVMGGNRNPSRIYLDGAEYNGLYAIPMLEEAHWRVASSGGTITIYLNGKLIFRNGGNYRVEGAVMNGYAKRHSTGEWREANGSAVAAPEQAPEPPPSPTSEFAYLPDSTGVTINIPYAHWQMHIFSRRKHITLYGPDKSGNTTYRINMTGQQLRDASIKAGDDGSLLVFVNTTSELTGSLKNAGWRILNPLAEVRGDGTRLKAGEDK